MLISHKKLSLFFQPREAGAEPGSFSIISLRIFFLKLYSPPMGAAKQLPTPTAHAAANISVFRDSFWYIPWKDVTNFDSNVADMDAMCTKGPCKEHNLVSGYLVNVTSFS